MTKKEESLLPMNEAERKLAFEAVALFPHRRISYVLTDYRQCWAAGLNHTKTLEALRFDEKLSCGVSFAIKSLQRKREAQKTASEELARICYGMAGPAEKAALRLQCRRYRMTLHDALRLRKTFDHQRLEFAIAFVHLRKAVYSETIKPLLRIVTKLNK